MKIILFIFFLFSSLSNHSFDKDIDNLTYFALKHSDEKTIRAYASYLARLNHSKEFFKLLKDKVKRNELIDRVEEELKAKLKTPQSTYIYNKRANLVKNKDGSYQITKFTNGITLQVHHLDKLIGDLPNYYFLLVSNLDLFENLKIENTPKPQIVYLKATVEIFDYKNKQDFQAVIKEVSVFKDKMMTSLITKIVEKRDLHQLSKSWLLADGYTNRLTGIHAFSILGFRIQDPLDSLAYKDNCKGISSFKEHKVVLCEYNYSNNSKLKIVYLGGKLAQFDIVSKGKLDLKERNKVIKLLVDSLGKKKKFFMAGTKQWSEHSSKFYFEPKSFDSVETYFLSNHVDLMKKLYPVNSTENIIFSMIGDNTIKLIESLDLKDKPGEPAQQQKKS